jgi:hypothetical protein
VLETVGRFNSRNAASASAPSRSPSIKREICSRITISDPFSVPSSGRNSAAIASRARKIRERTGADGAIHYACDFLVAQPFDFPQRNRRAQIRRQRIHRTVHGAAISLPSSSDSGVFASRSCSASSKPSASSLSKPVVVGARRPSATR